MDNELKEFLSFADASQTETVVLDPTKLWELFCTKCSKPLMEVKSGQNGFGDTKSCRTGEYFCDCVWKCCAESLPSNARHKPHLDYRVVKETK